ncbi:MAG: hypothetical protein MN733_24585 [Nitrososphaera sp.]|nr:hypothetical protein [Nitrososphaera sp.]
MKSLYLTFVALIILALFVSCRPSSPPPNPPLITVELTGTQARASYEETITQPNCGGSAEAENTVGRSRSIKYEIEVQHGLEVNANGQIGFAGTDIELGATVASQLGHSYGNEETLSRSVTVKASPRTNMVHRIKQEEVWQVGTATIVVGDSQMIVPFSFRHDFSVQLVDSYDRKDCDTLVAEPPTEVDNPNSPDNVNEPPIAECSFPQTGWIPPALLANGEWIYSCLSAGENNWVGQDESWKAANWKRGSGQSEIVNIVVPEGAATMGIGCDPCTILKPDGSTVSSAGGSFGSFQPNIQIGVSPGELYKARIFGGDTCPTRPSAVPPCSPEIYIWFNLQPTTLPQTPVSTSEPSNNCSKMIEGEHHSPILGTDWKFEAINEDRIIHIWSNHWAPNLPEYKFFLPAGQAVSFKSGGGSFWIDRPGCDGVAEVLFQRDTFQEIIVEEYQRYIEQQIIP